VINITTYGDFNIHPWIFNGVINNSTIHMEIQPFNYSSHEFPTKNPCFFVVSYIPIFVVGTSPTMSINCWISTTESHPGWWCNNLKNDGVKVNGKDDIPFLWNGKCSTCLKPPTRLLISEISYIYHPKIHLGNWSPLLSSRNWCFLQFELKWTYISP